MAVSYEIYAHPSGETEKYSFREADLKDGIMGPKRQHIGTLYAPSKEFALMPRNGKEPTNATESPPLVLAILKREHDAESDAEKAHAWTADEAIEKARGPEQGTDPIFIFVPAMP